MTTQAVIKWRQQRRRYLMADCPFCHYCNIPLRLWNFNGNPPPQRHFKSKDGFRYGYATLDHKVPLACGGLDNDANTLLACSRCNALKGDVNYHVFVVRLIQMGVISR